MNAIADYRKFLMSKRIVVPDSGFDVSDSELNSQLFAWQRPIVKWALRKGRAGVYLDTGLGKTLIQLVVADIICQRTGGKFLLLAPLAVSWQTYREAEKFGIQMPVVVAASQADVPDSPCIIITNYEKLHKFDVDVFNGVGLDEASILKSVDGKTRDKLIEAFQRTPYRYCYTATPSPNDTMEIGSYCEFLGVMNRNEMLSTYFIHDGGETSKWRLKTHAEKPFFRWMTSWAVMIRKPSDIGYSDDGYNLPPLTIHEHVVQTEIREGFLFQVDAATLQEQRESRRSTITERVRLVSELANVDVQEPWIVWCNLNDESTAAAKSIRNCVEITGSDSDERKEKSVLDFSSGTTRAMVSKPRIAGWGMNFQHASKMAFLGLDNSYEAFYQAIRRIYRFGQQRPCDVHVVISDQDGMVLENIRRKQKEADRLVNGLVEAMRDLTKKELSSTKRETVEYAAKKVMEVPTWLTR